MPIREIFRHAARRLRRQPGYALTCIATLALGLATAITSLAVVEHAFFDALPYRAAGQLFAVRTRLQGQASAMSPHVFEELRLQSQTSDLAAFRGQTITYAGPEGTDRLEAVAVSDRYFEVLGVPPALGRALGPADRDGIVLSWSAWQRRMGGSREAVGQTMRIDGRDRVILGVMPGDFVSPFIPQAELWLPLDMGALLAEPRARRSLTAIARLDRRQAPAQLRTELDVATARLQARFPLVHGGQALEAEPLRDALVSTARPIILATAGAALLLLLIVAANIGGLSAARAVGLQGQTRLRLALGATRARLVSDHLAEASIVGALGCVAGAWVADSLVDLAAASQAQFLPAMAGVTLNAGTIAIGCGAGMATCLIAVVLPQFTVTSMARFQGDWLRGSRDAGGPGGAPVRAALVVCQVALALALVAGAGLLVRTVRHLSATPLGFDAPQVVTVQATLPMPAYREPARQVEFDRAVLDRLAQLPGVQSVAMGAPLTGGMGASLSIFGQAQPEGRPEVTYFPISPGFLATLGIPLKEGRDLQATDTRDSERVVVINETMARQFWPRGDAIGSRVRLGPSTDAPWITIVGIAGDVRQHGVLQAVRPTSYGSTAQYFFPSRHYSLRVQQAPASIAADIRAVLRSIDPAVPVGAVSGLDEIVRRQLARQRLAMWVLTGFGVTALVLCGFGVYGVASLTSRLRRREFAIRAALGARPSRIRWIVVRQALVLAGLGSASGLGIAVAGTRLLAGLLHGVRPIDRPSFVAATAAVWLLAAFAAWYPARHAGRVDPLQALKHD